MLGLFFHSDEGFELKIPRWGFAPAKRGFEPNLGQEKRQSDDCHFSWLGMRDSNPRMLVPETSALPLGESPMD